MFLSVDLWSARAFLVVTMDYVETPKKSPKNPFFPKKIENRPATMLKLL